MRCSFSFLLMSLFLLSSLCPNPVSSAAAEGDKEEKVVKGEKAAAVTEKSEAEQEDNFKKERVTKPTDAQEGVKAVKGDEEIPLFSTLLQSPCPLYPDLKATDVSSCTEDLESLLESKETKHLFCLSLFVNLKVICSKDDKAVRAFAKVKANEAAKETPEDQEESVCHPPSSPARSLDCTAVAAAKLTGEKVCKGRNEALGGIAADEIECEKFCGSSSGGGIRPLCRHLRGTSEVLEMELFKDLVVKEERDEEPVVAAPAAAKGGDSEEKEPAVDSPKGEKKKPSEDEVPSEQDEGESDDDSTTVIVAVTTTITTTTTTTAGTTTADKITTEAKQTLADKIIVKEKDKSPVSNKEDLTAVGNTGEKSETAIGGEKPHFVAKFDESLNRQSSYFSYFVVFTILIIVLYLVFHNKQKILAMLLEGRRKNTGRRGRSGSSSAQYRKLDNNLEEAGGSGGSGSVIY